MGIHDLLMVAGEASGDLHGGRLLAELTEIVPEVRPFGLGGEELRAAGLEALADSSEISVVGVSEVLEILGRAREIYKQLLAAVDSRGARVAVLVDFPEFNLRLARALHRRGVKVIYYVSPQVWAWRSYRVRAIARMVNCLLVVLPFEVEFYRRRGVAAEYVGNPLVDEVPILPQIWDLDAPPGEGSESGRTWQVALLPGSRKSEVEALLPVMLDAARRLAGRLDVHFRLIKAPPIAEETLGEAIGSLSGALTLVKEERFEAIASSHLAICASGTATLEVGLLGTPLVVVHKVRPLSALLGRLLVKLDQVSLVNLVLGAPVVPELLQERATAEEIAAEAESLLLDQGRIRQIRSSLAQLRERLGERGASRRAAEAVARAGWGVSSGAGEDPRGPGALAEGANAEGPTT